MQIVSIGDSLHEMSNPVYWEKKENYHSSSAELAQRVVKVKKDIATDKTFLLQP